MEIYEPKEDSYFFADFLKDYFLKSKKDISYLDMGTGSGILSEVALKFLEEGNVLASDINEEAVDFVKSKGIPAIHSDLFSKIKDKFDLITFNVPYLPLDKREPKNSRLATTGGNRGDEISVKFLKEAMKHLKLNGKILLLVSSLTPMERIKKFGGRVVAKKKLFMEELFILEF